jgi:sRNA-binding protein
MITLHEAIRALNSSIITIRGDIAYDMNNQEVAYNMAQAEAKLAELQAQATAQEQAKEATKASALAKLTALGLTQAEVTALVG